MLPKPEIYGQKEEKYLNFQKKKIKQMKIEDKKRDFLYIKNLRIIEYYLTGNQSIDMLLW